MCHTDPGVLLQCFHFLLRNHTSLWCQRQTWYVTASWWCHTCDLWQWTEPSLSRYLSMMWERDRPSHLAPNDWVFGRWHSSAFCLHPNFEIWGWIRKLGGPGALAAALGPGAVVGVVSLVSRSMMYWFHLHFCSHVLILYSRAGLVLFSLATLG